MTKRILKSIFLFTVLSFAERGINYLITFMLAMYLSPEELGKLAYVLTIQSYIYPIVLMYTNGAILLHYSTGENGLNYFYNCGILNFSAFILVALVTLCTGLVVQLSYLYILLTLLVVSLLEALRMNFLSYNQAFLDFTKYAAVAIVFVLLNLVITFLFLMGLPLEYKYRVFALLISNVMVFALMIFYLRKEFQFHVSRELIKDALNFGLPLLPHALGLLSMESLNRYFLDSFGNKYELGLYSFAFTLAAPLGILNTAFNAAWTPYLYRLFKENSENSKKKVVVVHGLYLVLILALSTLFSIFSKNILSFFPAKYHGAYIYFKVIPFYFCVQAVYLIFAGALFYLKKNKHFFFLSFMNIVVSFLVNFILFTKVGISATPYCSILSLGIFTGFIVVLSQKLYPLPWAGVFFSERKIFNKP